MKNNPEKTFVGVPFYDQEPEESLQFLLKNINEALNNFKKIDATIEILVNGPNAKKVEDKFQQIVGQSYSNADINLIFLETGGQAMAINRLIKKAQEVGTEKIFITDTDIYRFPNSLRNLWNASNQGYDLIGARSIVFPMGIVNKIRDLSDEERFWYSVFEGDKHPTIKATTNKENKLKGSLMLINTHNIDPDLVQPEKTTHSDSCLNKKIPKEKKIIIPESVFMHFSRISLIDHIQARLRLAQDLLRENNIKKIFPPPTNQELIKETIKQFQTKRIPSKLQNLFLLRTALRQEAYLFIYNLNKNTTHQYENPNISANNYSDFIDMATNYPIAEKIIKQMFYQQRNELSKIEFNQKVNITQTENRTPIDITEILKKPELKKKYLGLILDSLGITNDDFLKL